MTFSITATSVKMVEALIQENEGEWNVSIFLFLYLVNFIATYSGC